VLIAVLPCVQNDLHRTFCQSISMIFESVTPMHHLMIMGSSVAFARRGCPWP
jgi:hypothetical protein